MGKRFKCGCVVNDKELKRSFGVYSTWYMSALCAKARDWYEGCSREGRDWFRRHLKNHPPTFDSRHANIFDFDIGKMFAKLPKIAYKVGREAGLRREKAFMDAFLKG